jgi:hypothetical protein
MRKRARQFPAVLTLSDSYSLILPRVREEVSPQAAVDMGLPAHQDVASTGKDISVLRAVEAHPSEISLPAQISVLVMFLAGVKICSTH